MAGEPRITLREGFAKAPRAPSFGNDSSDNDKPPINQPTSRGKWRNEVGPPIKKGLSITLHDMLCVAR